MIDTFAKDYLHGDLRDVRGTMLWKPNASTFGWCLRVPSCREVLEHPLQGDLSI